MDVKKTRIFSIAAILVAWALALITFWCVMAPTDALGYSLLFFYGVFPVLAFVISALNSYSSGIEVRLLILPVVFAIFTPLLQYFTFILANAIACNKDFLQALIGMVDEDFISTLLLSSIPSVIGLAFGLLARGIKNICAKRK